MFTVLLHSSVYNPSRKTPNQRPHKENSSSTESSKKGEEKKERVDLDNLNPRALC